MLIFAPVVESCKGSRTVATFSWPQSVGANRAVSNHFIRGASASPASSRALVSMQAEMDGSLVNGWWVAMVPTNGPTLMVLERTMVR